jgi:anaerobic dimethyl sulfoxide reductase subunit A
MAGEYPLRLITPHSFFRQHTSQDNNLWIGDEARHALWMSAVDAEMRGIRDGDLVRIFNPEGEGIMPAYVTSRIAPGTISIIYGAWYKPSQVKSDVMPDGIDIRGAANNFTPSKHFPWVNGPSHCSHLAQVQKLIGG